MRTLARVAASMGGSPQEMPTVFTPLSQAGFRPRRGAVTMIAGTPGQLKSMLALYWVSRMQVPTLFFSADTDAYETMCRAAAMVSGETKDSVEQALNRGERERYDSLLADLNIRWVFETDPTYRDIQLETAAYFEVFGQWPECIVVDNLMNVVGENEDEWGSMRDTTKVIKRLVRITNANVLVLHHMQENEKDEEFPPRRGRLQGKVSQLPEQILSLLLKDDELRVAPVKNRFGPGDASGRKYVTLYVDPARCRFYSSRSAMQVGFAS